MKSAKAGHGGHELIFTHSDKDVGELRVRTGADKISWGYSLNTQNYPTYGGEVVQILSCYVENLQIEGTVQTYGDLEAIYGYFLSYLQVASGGGVRNEEPMTVEYPHRGWSFKVIVTDVPGFRKGRDVVAPEWRITAHIVDDSPGDNHDVEELSELIITEAEIKENLKTDENFGLQGKIRFKGENPFSAPGTSVGDEFTPDDGRILDTIGDYYSQLLPSYLSGDFDDLFNTIGSKPALDVDVRGGLAKGNINDPVADPDTLRVHPEKTKEKKKK
jgi:hypothetical protein